MAEDHSDTVGFPAEPTRVYTIDPDAQQRRARMVVARWGVTCGGLPAPPLWLRALTARGSLR